jgi:hypothetical protein
LAYLTLAGVSQKDALVASAFAARLLDRNLRPDMAALLQQDQVRGPLSSPGACVRRSLTIACGAGLQAVPADAGIAAQAWVATGNLRPIVEVWLQEHGLRALCTEAVLLPSQIYSGRIDGAACVGSEKVRAARRALWRSFLWGLSLPEPGFQARRVRQLLHTLQPSFVLGFGNSLSDLPFLCLATEAYAVTPTSALRKEALERGWPQQYFQLHHRPLFGMWSTRLDERGWQPVL